MRGIIGAGRPIGKTGRPKVGAEKDKGAREGLPEIALAARQLALKSAFDGDDLSALVKAAAWADAVSLSRFAALFANLKFGQGQHAIGRNPLASTAPGGSSFWYSHCSKT